MWYSFSGECTPWLVTEGKFPMHNSTLIVHLSWLDQWYLRLINQLLDIDICANSDFISFIYLLICLFVCLFVYLFIIQPGQPHEQDIVKHLVSKLARVLSIGRSNIASIEPRSFDFEMIILYIAPASKLKYKVIIRLCKSEESQYA